ncbi:MAG: leucine-rich repeat domain-containing protein, partial [Oscillospiraceae bacterium]|nr:leucine-rich repeat domain-containing protein [Oscillospiraceae bacterium]
KVTGLKRIVIPSTVRTIDAHAFSSTALEEISIPEGVNTLGNGAFSNCNQLKVLHLTCPVPHMGTNIFANCENLERVILPEEMQKIPDSMFSMCENLKEVHLPSTLKLIERSAFSNCENLTEIEIPEKVIGIGSFAFEGCRQLNFVKSAGILFSIQEFSHQEEFKNIGETVSLIHKIAIWRWRTGEFNTEKVFPILEHMLQNYLKSPEEKALFDYLNQHFEPMLKSLIISKNTELIQAYLNQGKFFTEENIQKFILFANEKQAYEIQVMFSEYQRKHFALKSIAETIQNKFEL